MTNFKIRGDYSRVNEEEREFINKKLKKFSDKHEVDFDEMYVKLDCHMDKETSRGRIAYTCKVSVDTDHGRFNAHAHDFGAEKTISGALSKVDRQIQKTKR